MKHPTVVLKLFPLWVLMVLAWVPSSRGADVPKITKEDLKAILGTPDVIIVDVRTNAGWNESKLKIKGAVREDPTQATLWTAKYPKEKTLVFYCS